MKRIVSVSLGSSRRNHQVVVRIGEEDYSIERIGTDGSYEKAIELIKELDGKVDAFGMGGISMYLYGRNHHRYTMRSALPLLKAAHKTPMVDGSGLKNTLERHVVQYLKEELGIQLKEKTVLVVCGMERLGMAEGFAQEGCKTLYGDLMFALGIPYAFKELKGLHRFATVAMPLIKMMPMKVLYPSGQKQDINTPKFEKAFKQADIIAGDFLYIKKNMPMSIEGKIIVSNTVTSQDIELLRKRGAQMLVTSTPELNGRSFGTNVMEALACVLIGKKPEDITLDDYLSVIDQDFFTHRVVYF